MENASDIRFTFLTRDDNDALRDLYVQVFGRQVGEQYFVVKYGLDIPNFDQFSVVAKKSNQVIGFFGGIKQHFVNQEGKQMTMMSCGDYLLLKEYRGLGVFDQLYQVILQKTIQQKFDYIYAFNSMQTHKIAKKWGWSDEVGMCRLQINAYPFSTSKLINKLGLSDWRIQKLTKALHPFLSNIDINSLPKEKNLFYNRYDAQFFAMKKFVKHYLVEIAGCVLWVKYDYRLTIGFTHFTEEANISKMLKCLKSITQKALIHEIVFHVQENSKEAGTLKKQGTLQESFSMSAMPLKEDAPSFSNVLLNFMDMDVF